MITEQGALLERAKQGDREASEALVVGNTGLIWSIARRYFGRGVDPDDLYQLGCLGFLKAVEGFDPQYGTQFSTYAVPKIAGEIRRFLRDDGPIHISRTIHDNARRVAAFRQEWLNVHGCEPKLDEIAQALSLSREDVVMALNAPGRVRSLSEPIAGGDGDLRLMDVLGSEPMREVDSRITLSQLLRDLSDEERTLIVRRYFKSHTQSEIARDMGISQVQVSRLESRILKKMRAAAGES